MIPVRIREDVPEVDIHNGSIEQDAVQEVEKAADAWKEFAGIFDTGFAFEE